MITQPRLLSIVTALVLLTGCAQHRQEAQLQNQVDRLNRQLQTQTSRLTALERQNALNAQGNGGVYLLPAAQNSAVLQSAIGQLSVSLDHMETEANGTRALLHIHRLDSARLSPFSAHIDWGQIDPVSGKPLTNDMQTQAFRFLPPLLPKTEAMIELRLSGLSPEQLGFVRLYHIIGEEQTPPPVASTDAP